MKNNYTAQPLPYQFIKKWFKPTVPKTEFKTAKPRTISKIPGTNSDEPKCPSVEAETISVQQNFLSVGPGLMAVEPTFISVEPKLISVEPGAISAAPTSLSERPEMTKKQPREIKKWPAKTVAISKKKLFSKIFIKNYNNLTFRVVMKKNKKKFYYEIKKNTVRDSAGDPLHRMPGCMETVRSESC